MHYIDWRGPAMSVHMDNHVQLTALMGQPQPSHSELNVDLKLLLQKLGLKTLSTYLVIWYKYKNV